MAAHALQSPKPSTTATATATAALSGDGAASLAATYLGASFAVFIALLPRSATSYLASLKSRNRILSLKLFDAEDQIKHLKSRRRDDSRANARVAEILAGQRSAWQQQERRLLARVDAAEAERAALRAEVERLTGELAERDEMIDFIARGGGAGGDDGDDEVGGGTDLEDGDRDRYSEFFDRNGEVRKRVDEDCGYRSYSHRFSPPMPGSQRWVDRSTGWKDIQYDSLNPVYHMRHLVARRESPWKVDGESTGIASKLKLLENELSNLENVVKGDLSKVPSLMRKQTKRYQSLAQKIDDLCQNMQASDPCEPAIGPEFRTQRQTEFLREAFLLQSQAKETRQKLTTLHVEAAKSFQGDELSSKSILNTKRSLDSIRNNLKEIQRNMEIWLARIVGDLEGILASDGASRVRDYYMSRYPFFR